MSNLSNAPYYDRYDGDSTHKANGYTRVLAQPGRVEQASEFNEIQSMWRDYIGRLGNSMYSDGTIISGMSININGNSVTVESGQIYLGGLIRNVPEQELEINGTGVERIAARLVTSIVTADSDESLRDPAIGSENYNFVGADRQKETVELFIATENTPIDNSSSVVYSLEDGVIPSEAPVEDKYAVINSILAERTYDENGNYRVNGINLQPVPMLTDDDKIKIHISAGRAYVFGYQVTKSTMADAELERSTATRFVQSESHYYNANNMTYKLSNGPIAQVSNLTALVTVTGEVHYRGNIRGGSDSLNHVPVDSITEVYVIDQQTHQRTTFVQGRDYQLTSDQVDWSLTGDDAMEPDSGTTYYVTYVYNKSMVEGTDYELNNKQEEASLTFIQDGTQPDHNTRFYISYYYTLARRDLILLDTNGIVSVVQGMPDKYKDLITPYNGSPSFFEIGHVNVFPKNAIGEDDPSHIAEVVNYSSTRLTQDNLSTLVRRVDALEESTAALDLEREVEDGEDLMSLNGYFTDVFDGLNKSDVYYDVNGVKYTATIDIDSKELTAPIEETLFDLNIDDSASMDYATFGTIISAPYEEQLLLQQKYYTGTMKVNPYASYGPMCRVEISPKKDNWVDTNSIVVYNTVERKSYTTSYQTVTRQTYGGGWWSGNRLVSTATNTETIYNGKTVEHELNTTVSSSIIEFMRQKTINVEGSAFGANSSNIYLEFNGSPVSLIATGTTSRGADRAVKGVSYRTVNADGNGHFTAKFTVPSGVPCGTVSVELISPASGNSEGDEFTGHATYSCNGTLLTYTHTNTTVVTDRYTVLTTTTNTYQNDPLAQSFIMSDKYDRNLVKIGLYFATKSTNRPVIVQVRNMVNGYPGETVYAEVELKPEDVNLPGSNGIPVVTYAKLNQPVYCYAGVYYCFCILSDSNQYSMYYAELGKNMMDTGTQLVVNPYATGVMFSSSNASTWTAHQGADLKFELYRSYYTGNGEIIFNNVTQEDITGVLLDAAYEVAGDDTDSTSKSSLVWYYRYRLSRVGGTSNYSEWLPIDTLVSRSLGTTTGAVQLKAVITVDYSTSPFIDKDRVALRSLIDDTNATYISKHLTADDFEEPYQKMKISYLAAMPSGASHRAYYMDRENGTWVPLESDGENIVLETSSAGEEFVKYEWLVNKLDSKVLNPSSPGAEFFKFRFDLTTTIRYNKPRIKRFATIFRYE